MNDKQHATDGPDLSDYTTREAITATATTLAKALGRDYRTVAALLNATIGAADDTRLGPEEQMLAELFFDELASQRQDCLHFAQGHADIDELEAFETRLRDIGAESYHTGGNNWAWRIPHASRTKDLMISDDGDLPTGHPNGKISVWHENSEGEALGSGLNFDPQDYDAVATYAEIFYRSK